MIYILFLIFLHFIYIQWSRESYDDNNHPNPHSYIISYQIIFMIGIFNYGNYEGYYDHIIYDMTCGINYSNYTNISYTIQAPTNSGYIGSYSWFSLGI